eukprot:7633863-Lingulodinium_polyedra.AAC.1
MLEHLLRILLHVHQHPVFFQLHVIPQVVLLVQVRHPVPLAHLETGADLLELARHPQQENGACNELDALGGVRNG